MQLLITSEGKDSLILDVTEFSGIEVFEQVREQWGYDWDIYEVTQGDQVRERVLNPRRLG